MFSKYSFAGVGWLVALIGLVVNYFGLDLDEAAITELAIAFVTVFGFVQALLGQLLREDLDWGLFRKEPLE